MPRSLITAALALSLHLAAPAQIHHGTAIIAIRHGDNLVIAADSLESALTQADTSACKIFTSGTSVFSLAGIGGIGPTRFDAIFQRDPAFTHPYDAATFQRAATRWASATLDTLNTHFRQNPQDYWSMRKQDRSSIAIFAGITSTSRLILIQARIHDDFAHVKTFPYLTSDSRIIAIDETLVMGAASLDTYAELHAATTPRALAAKSLLFALDRPPSLEAALQTAQSFIATTERWRPQESAGDIAELAISPLGIVWTNRTSACR